jgi:AcrR family transcriptional regulator
MRDIGSAAEVPYALVTYHFKSKLGVYQALFRRRQDLLTNQRVESLRALQLTGDRGADIRAIAAAIVEPLINMRGFPGGVDFARLIAREICDPRQSEHGIVAEFIDPVAHAAIRELTAFIAAAWTGMLTPESAQSTVDTRSQRNRSLHRDSALQRDSSRRRA